jgi:hypothetical protein
MLRALLIAALVLAVAAPAALADDFDKVFKDFSADGRIDPCKHSAAQLQRARKGVPPDIEQYAPDFPDALDQAIEARARGKCDKKAKTPAPAPAQANTTGPVGAPKASTGTTTGATGPTTAAAAAPPPAPTANSAPAGAPDDNAIARAADARNDGGGSDVPAPLIGLAVLAGLLAVAGLAIGLARWRAWEPPWALRARHAAGEAGWRASATWAEFSDWLRLGR